MRYGDEFKYVEAQTPFKGLNTSIISTRLDPGYASDMLNFVVRDGIAYRRAGYLQLGQQLVGRVLQIIEPSFVEDDANIFTPLVVLTEHRQYYFDTATGLFVDLTPGQVSYAITSVDQGNKRFVIGGEHADDFPEDYKFPVTGSTGNDGIYTVVAAGDAGGLTTIQVVESIPDDTADGDIEYADSWSNTPENGFIDWVVVTDHAGTRLIITNGQDVPLYWDGETDNEFVTWTPDFPGEDIQVYPQTLAVHFDHLFMGGFAAVGLEPTHVAWSDVANFDDFENGTAGSQILNDAYGPIRKLQSLGDRLIIYTDESAIASIFVGTTALVFGFETIIPRGLRLASPASIVSLHVGHVLPSEKTFLLFDGTRSLRSVGDPIWTDYRNTKDFANLKAACALNDGPRNTVYFAIPDVDSEVTLYTMEYEFGNVANVVWAKEKYEDYPTAFGYFTKVDTVPTWNDTAQEADLADSLGLDYLTWEQEVGPWYSESEQQNYPVRCFGDDDGRVYTMDENIGTDNGVWADAYYQTADFSVPNAFLSSVGRWVELEFEALGSSSVVVTVSTDRGEQVLIGTETMSATPRHYNIPFDRVGRTISVRFTVSEGTFQLRWARLWVTPGGPR
jgi:hypothetical protein